MVSGQTAERLRSLVAGACLVLLAGCMGGDDSTEAQPLSTCAATLDVDGSITLPAVATADGTFQYVLIPAPTDNAPRQFLATRSIPAASLDCAAVAFEAASSAVLKADNIDRGGQLLSIEFTPKAGSAGLIFDKTDGTVAGGLLAGNVGGDLTPLAQASLKVHDSSGRVIATGVTNEYGSIILSIEALPDQFNVVATGGTLAGKPFQGSLKAQIENYTTVDVVPSLTLTPLSTIVAAYHERSPALSLNESMSRVKQQLGIPDTFDADSNDQGAGDYFSNTSFYAAADGAGGVDTLVQALLDQWEQGIATNFAPAVAVDRTEPSALMKELPVEGLLGLVGKAYSVYSAYKTQQFQAGVINALIQIQADIRNIKSEMGELKEKVGRLSYDQAFTKVEVWKDVVTPAFTELHWLATNPQRDYKPATETCTETPPPKGSTARMALTAGCQRYADWLDRAKGAQSKLKRVIRAHDLAVEDGTRGDVLEQRGEPMERFKLALAGSPNVVGAPSFVGMLRDYRELVFLAKTNDKVASKRLFFTPEDSNRIWDHYRFWKSLHAQTYFFIADYLAATDQQADLATLKTAYAEGAAAAAKQMPMRVLPMYAVIDPVNRFYNGNPVTGPDIGGARVGGPMMYAPPMFNSTCGGLRPPSREFDSRNETIQAELKQYLDCANLSATPVFGVRDWRIPTYREWEAFTLTSGIPRPDAVTAFEGRKFSTVGEWMGARGFNPSLEGQLVFAASTACEGSVTVYDDRIRQYVNRPCSSFTVPFQFISGQWRPFIWFGGNHTVDRYANKGNSGIVYLTRPVNVGEYW